MNATSTGGGGVTITNTGNGTVNFSSFTFTGTNAADFSINSNQCSTALLPDTTCTIYLQFTPFSTGLRTASLQIADDASNTPQTIALIGAGQADAEVLYTSAHSLDFGSQNINSGTSNGYISLENEGTSNITFTSIQINGVNASEITFYSSSNNICGTTLTPGSNAAGERTATLNIIDNASGSPQTRSPRNRPTHQTTAPPSATTLDFGLQASGVASSLLSVQINNTGNDAVNISVIKITGTNAADFQIQQQNNSCTSTFTSYCYVYVQFTPSTTAAETATLTVSSDSSSGPILVTLIGEAKPRPALCPPAHSP